MHPTCADDYGGWTPLIVEDHLGEIPVIGLSRGLDAVRRVGMLFLVLDKIVVRSWEGGSLGTGEAIRIFAVRDDSDYGYVGQ